VEHESARVSPARIFARPEAGQIWLGTHQRAALASLATTAPLRVLVGPQSSGKTTLARHWAAQQDVVLQCRGPKENAAAVLAQLLLEAQLTSLGLAETDQRNLLTVFVRQRRSQGRRVVLAIDDADLFAEGAWNEIERLVAWRIDGRAGLDVLLVGPSPLLRTLRKRGLLGDDATTASLNAPTRDEVRAYLDWRLAPFAPAARLTVAAADAIAELAGGRYSAVDILAQMAFLLAQRHAAAAVDRALVREAAAALAARRVNTARLPALATAQPAQVSGLIPVAFVVVSRHGKIVEQVELRNRTLLGRSQHNDLVLASPGLSRHHAAILGTAEGYYIVDLNSKNGLAVNGRETTCALLDDGDVDSLGPFRVKLKIRDAIALGDELASANSADDTAVLPVPSPALGYIRRIK
jgi:type II secretory pathway predicted ATPase ExeA